jgi:murein DD-endopeptidase MepM/ murein hydrolase activator NlpD
LNSFVKFEQMLMAALQQALGLSRAYPRTLAAGLTVCLTGFGAAAFGTAETTSDSLSFASPLVTEAVASLEVEAQLDALAEHAMLIYRSDQTRASDTVDSLLRRTGVRDVSAADFLRKDPMARKLLEGASGKGVQVTTDQSGLLVEMIARYAPADLLSTAPARFHRLRVAKGLRGEWVSAVEAGTQVSQLRTVSGTVRSTLFAATDDAGLPDAVATQLVEIFSNDVNFHNGLHKGDTFSVAYETMTADGEPVTWAPAHGQIRAAEFVNNGRKHSAVWFSQEVGRGAYFSLDGRIRRSTLFVNPVEFSRVTSGFAMRVHPIQNTWTQHNGVDFAAPGGTPVRAAGGGVVEFAGQKNGYGNVVELRHANQFSTLYAHLSRIDVQPGQRIEQGTNIGAVGATGWATGPHLHFEVKKDGQYMDPMMLANTPDVTVLTAMTKPEFVRIARSLKEQLGRAQGSGRSAVFE